MEGIKDLFVNPGREYRAKPFWAWNGKLEKDELKRQLEVIKKMGFGGFFMHSRTGLATEYLGEEWFDITNFVADEAEKMGLEAWLYDEDRWPSGTAGGMVTKNPEYRIKYMRMSVIPSSDFRIDSNTIACFGAKIEENNLIEYKRVQTSFDAKGYEKILVFEIVMGKSSTWFNNTTYLDTMDKDAVQAFIESTHEKYKSKCGERLGKSIKGIFTDEPERGSLIRGSGCDFPIDGQYIPYTRKLFSEFIKKFGYDLIDHLPELWFVYKEQVINQATWHYILLLQDLFCENYFKRINTWCKDNSLIFTGHAIEESTLASQIDFAGSLMRCYEEMEYPGMDMLTANRYFWTDVKQLSSVAHQTGKKWMLSELYGATGWDFNFEGHKNVGSWQSLYGISLRCPHLSWYTMSGEAKRDYPASILHQSAWYGEYKRVEDYFARFAVLNTETNPVCDILYITPIESVMAAFWINCKDEIKNDTGFISEVQKVYKETTDYLCESQIDFDYGDEDIISRRGSIIMKDGVPILKVGCAEYKKVLISGMVTMRQSTYDLLMEFIAKGGKVFIAGEEPTYIDALPDNRTVNIKNNASLVSLNKNVLKEALSDESPLVYTNNDKILMQLRTDSDGRLFCILLNSAKYNQAEELHLTINKSGILEKWDLMTGERYKVKISDTKFDLDIELAPGEDAVFVVTNIDENLPKEPEFSISETVEPTLTGYELSEENLLVLDTAKYRINNGAWQDKKDVLIIDRQIRDALHIDRRGGEKLQPWYIEKYIETPDKGMAEFIFEFGIEEMPKEDIFLCMEEPKSFELEVNGNHVDTDTYEGEYIDIAFKRIRIRKELLLKGNNIIETKTKYNFKTNLEPMYLTGNFGVRTEKNYCVIINLPEKLEIGDITGQGLPFYGGRVRYFFDIPASSKLLVEVENIDAALLVINPDKDNKAIISKPYIIDTTGSDGKLVIDAVLTRRNTFGPYHIYPAKQWGCQPQSFYTTGDAYKDEFVSMPMGLLSSPKVHIC